MNHGEVPSFRLKSWIDSIYALIDADEVERALWMCNNLPAYYRDHEPEEISKLRADILSKLITPHGYMTANFDCDIYDNEKALNVLQSTIRGRLIWHEVRTLNKAGLHPHIVDLGPGEYWLPIALRALGYRFKYEPVAMDQRVHAQFNKNFAWDAFHETEHFIKVFVAFEVIEHLSDVTHLRWEAHKYFKGGPDIVHISTPCYTYDAKPKDWIKIGLPHLRAYTPREFIKESESLFPSHYPQLFLDPVMSIRMVPRLEQKGIIQQFSIEDLSKNDI